MDIHLTEAGRTAAESESEDDSLEDIIGALSEEERAAFGAALEKLIARLESRLGDEGGFGPRGDPRRGGWEHLGRRPWPGRDPRGGFPRREGFD